MMLQNVQSAITTIVAPVVMVTACAILVGGMLTQYNQTNERLRTFAKVILPMITPAIISGALLSFARALGEFGSIVVVAGNIPRSTLTAPVYVFGQIESQNQMGASAVSILLLALSFTLMLLVDWAQGKRGGANVTR